MYCHKDDINVIYELLAVKDGYLESDLFSNSVLDTLLSYYVLINFTACLCTLYDIFIINAFFPSKTTITLPTDLYSQLSACF